MAKVLDVAENRIEPANRFDSNTRGSRSSFSSPLPLFWPEKERERVSRPFATETIVVVVVVVVVVVGPGRVE